MKPWRTLLLLVLLCGLLCACGPESDVVIRPHADETQETPTEMRIPVVINQNSMTYHLDPACRYLASMAEENRLEIEVPDLAYLTEHGYTPCGGCSRNK